MNQQQRCRVCGNKDIRKYALYPIPCTLYLWLFVVCYQVVSAQSAAINYDSLKKEHGELMGKASSFFSVNKSAITSRIKKTERMAGTSARDTSAAKLLIKLYQSDSSFYHTVIHKGDSLQKALKKYDERLLKTKKSELSDKLLFDSEEKTDKVKQIIDYAKDNAKQIDKRLTAVNKELNRMRKETSKQEKK